MTPELKAFLTQQGVTYTSLKHPVAYTAQEIAAAQHIPGKQLAKCVLVRTNHGVRLAVLPAMHRIEFSKLKTLLNATSMSLASEADIKQTFPGVEVGAMSVFGNLYSVPVVVDKSLSVLPEIVCNAGNHSETIKLRYREFERTVKPKAGNFIQAPPTAKAKAKAKAKVKAKTALKKKKAKAKAKAKAKTKAKTAKRSAAARKRAKR
jgi:Ala-tRNA(Pro) deacylase